MGRREAGSAEEQQGCLAWGPPGWQWGSLGEGLLNVRTCISDNLTAVLLLTSHVDGGVDSANILLGSRGVVVAALVETSMSLVLRGKD